MVHAGEEVMRGFEFASDLVAIQREPGIMVALDMAREKRVIELYRRACNFLSDSSPVKRMLYRGNDGMGGDSWYIGEVRESRLRIRAEKGNCVLVLANTSGAHAHEVSPDTASVYIDYSEGATDELGLPNSHFMPGDLLFTVSSSGVLIGENIDPAIASSVLATFGA